MPGSPERMSGLPTRQTETDCKASAEAALEEARNMPPGSERSDALKKAGLLRRDADAYGIAFAKKGRPEKT